MGSPTIEDNPIPLTYNFCNGTIIENNAEENDSEIKGLFSNSEQLNAAF
ncbi:hypothetical protein [Enterococcus mundtii]|uniref:Uncharacterized protein n=1 Tax=Enterococcus mundtii TaxID=53346 RepID=A0A242KVJ8_ENTMU|nr:hypothetical protein [Enterococcus mundtii]OTP24880.1 hypothetical protein A5802_003035 [Enterococcus mundtii]